MLKSGPLSYVKYAYSKMKSPAVIIPRDTSLAAIIRLIIIPVVNIAV
jgi:hypothetical protein